MPVSTGQIVEVLRAAILETLASVALQLGAQYLPFDSLVQVGGGQPV